MSKVQKRSDGRIYYFVKGFTYLCDDMGNLVQVTFENLGSATSYYHAADH